MSLLLLYKLVMFLVILTGTECIMSTSESESESAPTTISIYPQKCQKIVEKYGTVSTYPVTSVARGFSTLCSIKDEFTGCLDKHRVELRKTKFPLSRMMADFSLIITRYRLSQVCTMLENVWSDLECLKNVTEYMDCNLQQQMLLNQSGLTTGKLCRIMKTINTCIRNAARDECPKKVLDFYRYYTYVFIPTSCSTLE